MNRQRETESDKNLSCGVFCLALSVSALSNISCLVKPGEVRLAEHIRSTHSSREKQHEHNHTLSHSHTRGCLCDTLTVWITQVARVFFLIFFLSITCITKDNYIVKNDLIKHFETPDNKHRRI